MRNMVYDYEDTDKYIFAEDIEEAIIQYLEKHGIPREKSEQFNMRYMGDDGREITTKCLKIVW